ncbi:MAG: hypothetical protein QXU18_12030 [Thermoplasmatales archaeon]
MDVSSKTELEGLEVALKIIEEIKQEIEDLHGNSIKRGLRNAMA